MNANPKFLAATAQVDDAAIQPLPNSRKIYVQGSRPDIRVPMREISQSDTPASFGAEKNPPIYVYDTSGPYTEPGVKIDIRSGLAAPRLPWILERADTEELPGPTFAIRHRAPERSAIGRAALQPAPQAAPRHARQERVANALCAARHHHAGNGIRRDPRKHVPQGISGKAESIRPDGRQTGRLDGAPASGPIVRRVDSRRDHAGIRARRNRARPCDHPRQHQPPGSRADDYRPQFPGQDQRQYRQFGGRLRRSAKKSRK